MQMPVHRIKEAKREREKQALDRYVEQGAIAKVNEPTAGCFNELIRETPKKVRIYIDPSQTVNRTIHRPKHQIPTLNGQRHKLSAAKKKRPRRKIHCSDGTLSPKEHQAQCSKTSVHAIQIHGFHYFRSRNET